MNMMKSVDLVTTSNWKHYTNCKNKTKNVFTKDALEKKYSYFNLYSAKNTSL